MELKNLYYLMLLTVFFLATLAFYIRKNKETGTNLKYLIPAVFISGLILVLCEINFSDTGLKNYNPDFITGILLRNLPLESWLYYLILPFSGVLIFDYLNLKLKNPSNSNPFLIISLLLLIFFGSIAWFFRAKTYSFFIFFLLFVYFGYVIFRNRFKHRLAIFYLAYLVFIIPCFMADLILVNLPAVSYDIQYNTGKLLFFVPVENFGIYFLILLMTVTINDFFAERRFF